MKITSVRSIIQALESAAGQKKPLLIVAEDFEQEPILAMVINKYATSFHLMLNRS